MRALLLSLVAITACADEPTTGTIEGPSTCVPLPCVSCELSYYYGPPLGTRIVVDSSDATATATVWFSASAANPRDNRVTVPVPTMPVTLDVPANIEQVSITATRGLLAVSYCD